ncbi:MAG: bi-domain-containing oxidoreductase, partial [Thermodesulfobacteriota bacterium]
KNGEVQVIEVTPPVRDKGLILIKNHYSLISPGTEGSTVRVARQGIIGKIKERPEQARQVVELLKERGPVQTYRALMKRLDAYSQLGYSSAGKVIEVGPGVQGISVGDSVACGGAGYANHAEIVAVPTNLCVKLPPDADLQKAAYNTLGAIALQGIRQADTKIGETCAVIGLGLIGQLTALILRASGVKVIGIDIDPRMVEIARQHCLDLGLVRNDPSVLDEVFSFTQGIGADAVIITAATQSLDPINLAGTVARKKGRVVIVGNVPTGFEREPYYRKELELRMSCSYGPGRYDMAYEEKGIDYPVGYVRWTEKRNMEAFQELIYSRKIAIDYLTTHIFDLEDAPKAYDLILKREEPCLGMLIRYKVGGAEEVKKKIVLRERKPLRKINIGFIGAGSYAQSYLLPNIPKNEDIALRGILDASGTVSRRVAEKYGFEFCTSDEKDIFENEEINTVFIATRHDSHAHYVLKALQAGKNVHVEKPLCLKESELEEIREFYESLVSQGKAPVLLVGYNRRFSPLTKILKERFGDGPMAMIYRINAGHIPGESWIQDRDIGGGRIIGEVCHFVDLLTFLNGSLPESLWATALLDAENLDDTISINLRFKNGSIGTISYFSNGSKRLFKEYLEVYKSGMVGILKDFKQIEILEKRKIFKKKLLSQDKGQKAMIASFFKAIKSGQKSPISFDEICSASEATFKIIKSIRTQENISFD